MSNKIGKLETNNKKILEFYERTKLDFESMNLLIIEIYEKMSSELSGTLDKRMTTDILSTIKSEQNNNEQFRKEVLSTINNSVDIYKMEISNIKQLNTILTTEMMSLKDIIIKLNNDITNSVIAKLFEIKQSYIDDVKNILSSKDSSNILKLMELIEKENGILIDKTLKTINETIPKSNSQYLNNIESLINSFKSEISLLKNNNNIEDLSTIIDNKYNNLLSNIQQTMMLNISLSEERINKNISELKEYEIVKQTSQDNINNDLLSYLNKFKNSTIKGAQSEAQLINILEELYPLSEIINTSNESKKCDVMIKRENKPTILIENKSYQSQVSKDEVIKFCRDIEYQNVCGIMISQTSNIGTKENYQIDIINNNVLLYISNCNYDIDKIKMGISIVDHLYPKINDNTNNNVTKINNEIMGLINEEYKKFLNQREAIKNYLNDSNKKIISQLYEMELPNLNNILLSKFTIVQDINLTCNICKKFVGLNKKSLAKHKNSCIKKNDSKSSEEEILEDLNEIDDKTAMNILEEEYKKSSSEEETISNTPVKRKRKVKEIVV